MRQLASDLEILLAIDHYQQSEGAPPSLRELALMMGYSTPSAISHRLKQLETRGYIRLASRKSRRMVLLAQAYSLIAQEKAS